ncbi:hypothetical protein ACS0TY_022741 [Phlomoides rotata]
MATVAATGGSSNSSREARRRRIIERGSDRLALITGRIQSLPPDPEPDLGQSHSSTFSPVQTPAESAQHEDVALISSLPNQESSREQQHLLDEIIEPLLDNSNKGGGRITSRTVTLHDTKEESSRNLSSTQSPAQDHQHEQRSQSHHNILTPGQIRSAIAGSENIRLCCSVAAAILVILLYVGFPILGFRYIRGIMMLRPVYLLLVTNISIVISRVLLGAQGVELRRKSSSCIIGGNSSIDQLTKALDLASLFQNIVRAWFMDFSIYTVVLVSGLSLVRGFGW